MLWVAKKMKSIIIISHALEIGGAERALLGLLESFDYSKYDVSLFLMRHEGDLIGLIPEKVNLLPEIKEYTGLAVPLTSIVKKGLFGVAAGRVIAKIKAKRFVKSHNIKKDNGVGIEYSHKYTVKMMPVISDKEYDLAISFLTPHYFAAEKVKAKKKIALIHTDYSTVDIDVKSEEKMWSKYDHIVSISDDCTKGFLSKFPGLESKILPVENIISPDFIHKQAEMEDVSDEMNGDAVKLLSVGRFSTAKNFDNVPDICRRIIDKGINVKWFLVGYGGDEELIRNKIKEAGMEEHVIILGKKSNPYPYIKNCDVYVQPSRYEGKCVAVREAQILGKPVIITDYATANSQLKNGFDGVIVPLDNERCAESISELLKDTKKLNLLSKNCTMTDYSNTEELEKLYTIIEKD